MMSAIKDLLLSVSLGTPVHHGSLTMIPLIGGDAADCDGSDFPVLDEAISSGLFRVREVSEQGSVPHLLAINDLDGPVFLLDGEELVGAKQNRVLNLSFLVPPRAETVIPVSCVEAGRWQRHSAEFAGAPRAQFAEGRARKLQSVTDSLETSGMAFSNQQEVWELIQQKSERMATRSPTAAMSQIFEESRTSIDGYVDAFPAQAGQIGAIFAIGQRIAGMDLFASSRMWFKLGPKVSASYAVDAIEASCSPAVPETVTAFIEAMLQAAERRFAAAGAGETIRLSGDSVKGAALEAGGKCLHLAAFPI